MTVYGLGSYQPYYVPVRPIQPQNPQGFYVPARVMEERPDEAMFRGVLRMAGLPEEICDSLLNEGTDVSQMDELYQRILLIKNKGEEVVCKVLQFMKGTLLQGVERRELNIEVDAEKGRVGGIVEFLKKVQHYSGQQLYLIFFCIDRLRWEVEDFGKSKQLFNILTLLHSLGKLPSSVDLCVALLCEEDLKNPEVVCDMLDVLVHYDEPHERLIEVAKGYLMRCKPEEKANLLKLMQEDLDVLELYKGPLFQMGAISNIESVVEDFLAIEKDRRVDVLAEIGINPFKLTQMQLPSPEDREYLMTLIGEYEIVPQHGSYENFRIVYNCLTKVKKHSWDRTIQDSMRLTYTMEPKNRLINLTECMKRYASWNGSDKHGMRFLMQHKLLSGVTEMCKIPLFGMMPFDTAERELYIQTVAPLLQQFHGDARMSVLETLLFRHTTTTTLTYLQKLLYIGHYKSSTMNAEQFCEYLDSLFDLAEPQLDKIIYG